MFEHVSGILVSKTPVRAVVECAGVGYLLTITLSTYETLPETGKPAKLLVHLVHKEDAMELYGFATADEREFFRKLIAITRVGPKLAMAILSGTTMQNLANAVALGDISTISKIPRVGKKTAERIVLELKGKLEHTAEHVVGDEIVSSAIAALVGLGFTPKEAYDEVFRVKAKNPNASLDELIRFSLRSSGK